MSDREKLIELLVNNATCGETLGLDSCGTCSYRYDKNCYTLALADHLISKGVTVQKWIPVSERLPQIGQIVLVHQMFSWEKWEAEAAVTIGRLRPVPPNEKPYWEFQHYRPDFRRGTIMDNDIVCPGNEYVTHWMPLPEPPKECE